MGWDIRLENPDGTRPQVDRHQAGSTIMIGGSTEAWMNLTYNYSPYYYTYFPEDKGLKWLNDKPAGATIEMMQTVLDKLGDAPSDNYWESSAGNAGHALGILISWARQHPTAVWRLS